MTHDELKAFILNLDLDNLKVLRDFVCAAYRTKERQHKEAVKEHFFRTCKQLEMDIAAEQIKLDRLKRELNQP